MSNYLTEPEAWREIARRIAEGEWGEIGLCSEVVALNSDLRICPSTAVAMRSRIRSHLNIERWAYRHGTESEARILAALWLALEAEEEETP